MRVAVGIALKCGIVNIVGDQMRARPSPPAVRPETNGSVPVVWLTVLGDVALAAIAAAAIWPLRRRRPATTE